MVPSGVHKSQALMNLCLYNCLCWQAVELHSTFYHQMIHFVWSVVVGGLRELNNKSVTEWLSPVNKSLDAGFKKKKTIATDKKDTQEEQSDWNVCCLLFCFLGTQQVRNGSTQSPPPTTEEPWASCWSMISPTPRALKTSANGCATLTRWKRMLI